MPTHNATTARLDQIFAEWDTSDRPGMAVGVIRSGEPVYEKCFGLANVEHGVQITPSTAFNIASLTKQFTAAAVLILQQDGRLSLDDEVRQYLPDLQSFDPPVHIRHCLYHTSGLNDWISALELSGPSSDYCSRKRAFRAITAMRRAMFPAGQAHSYSNTGYLLLAWIVEQVTGAPLPQVLKSLVFGPLAMTGSGFLSDAGEIVPDLAQGYYVDVGGSFCRGISQSEVHGDGGMHATIADMVAWLRGLSSNRIGDSNLRDRMFEPGRLDDGTELRYTAGWEIDRFQGTRVFRHGGMGEGYQSHIAWAPEHEIGIAILANVRPCWPWPAANRILDMLLDQRSAGSGSASGVHDDGLTGRYFTTTGLPVSVDWRGDRLFIDIWLWCTPFIRRSRDTYCDEEAGDVVTFHRNSDGNVTHFTLKTVDGACPRMHSPICRADRYEDVVVEPDRLAIFEGQYFNDALETLYHVEAIGEGLIARHLRCYDWHLQPIMSRLADSFATEFAQTGNWPGMVTFEVGDRNDVSGFTVRGTRFNLFFQKL